MYLKNNAAVILALVVLFSFHQILVRKIQFTPWPEMLTYPWLLTVNFRLYGDIIHPYQPLLPLILKFIYFIFGNSVLTLFYVTQCTAFFIVSSMYYISNKYTNWKWAILLTITYIVTMLGLEGNGLWFDIASLLFIIPLLILELTPKQKVTGRANFFIGILLGMAILIKQTNLVFICALMFGNNMVARCKVLLGVLMVLVIPIIYYLSIDQLGTYMFWSWQYPLTILRNMPGFELPIRMKQILLVLMLISPLTLVLILKKEWKYMLWILPSALFAFPRFALFHLQPLLAILFLIMSIKFNSFSKEVKVGIIAFYLFLGTALFINQSKLEPKTRFFDESVLKTRASLVSSLPPDTRVFYYNVPSQYFVNTPLVPARPWADLFPWYFELNHVQISVLKSLNEVTTIVYKPFISGSEYSLGSYKPRIIDEYIQKNFIPTKTINDELVILQRKQ